MKKKNQTSKILFTGLLAVGTIHGINQLTDKRMQRKNILEKKGETFRYRDTDVFYTVQGKGEPVLLVHDLQPQSSGFEWEKVKRRLERKFRVYVIDLPGCGRSEKPWQTYTDFYYIECLRQFIQEVIQGPATVVASGASAPILCMLDKVYPETVKKAILVNPAKLSSTEEIPDWKSKLLRFLIDLPVFGRFIYNIEMSESNLDLLFRDKYFLRKSLVDHRMIAGYYEGAHIGEGRGRHLLASLRGCYMGANVRGALKELTNLCIITSRSGGTSYPISREYEKLAKSCETAQISGSRYLPQLETPERLARVLERFL